jgi:nucleoid-associated protein EbfC
MNKGFGGMPGNLNKLMKQAQKMQEEIQKAQAQAADIKAEATVGGGMVKAVATGDNQLSAIMIEKEVVNPNDVEMLQDLIRAAVNEALKKVGDEVQSRISRIAGGLSMPGIK